MGGATISRTGFIARVGEQGSADDPEQDDGRTTESKVLRNG